jgi:hypothetical protein
MEAAFGPPLLLRRAISGSRKVFGLPSLPSNSLIERIGSLPVI